jgi:hypothetical protein
MRRLLMTALALAASASASVQAQDVVVMRRAIAKPNPGASAPAPAATVCGSYQKGVWSGGNDPKSTYYKIGDIMDAASAKSQCEEKAKSVGLPGICIYHESAPGETWFITYGTFAYYPTLQDHTGTTCNSK